MSQRGQSHALQLFPFLAVLVCVMGSLIFLLLLTTWRIRDQAIARADAERAGAVAVSKAEAPEPQVSEPEYVAASKGADATPVAANVAGEPADETRQTGPNPVAAREQRRSELLAQLAERTHARDRQTIALQQQQLFVTAAQKRTQAVRAELQQIERQLGTAAGQAAVARLSAPEADNERRQLEQQILTLRRQLKQAEIQQHAAEGKFAVVPFDGKSGTTRRPVFIECTDTGFRFHPEGVLIRPSDIEGFTDRYNPLLAGAMALSSYWDRKSDATDPSTEPYVLLLVRPSGTVAFYISQRLLSKLNQPFGYELIPEDLPLHFPEADPGAQAACEAAVQRVLAERGPVANSIAETHSGAGNSGNGHGGAPDRGNVSGVERPRVAPAGPNEGFALDDVDKSRGVGDRSWEHVERFDGQEHRRSTTSAGSSPTAPQSSGVSRPPRSLAESGKPVRPEGAPSNGEASPGDSSNGSGTPQVTTAEFYEPRGRSFAAQRSSRPGDQSLPYEQLQRRRWGQFGPNATIGIEHEVLIRVDAQRLIVDDRWAVPVPSGISRTDLFDRLLSVVDRQANGWGQAPTGFFWVPRLKFVVSPGGNQVYDRIAPLVTKSGLEATTEFAKKQ